MRTLLPLVALLLLTAPAVAGSLDDEIAAADQRLFHAFNARDLEGVAAMFDRSLEFYHDRGGLAGYEQTLRQLKENFARPNGPRRELVPGTVEVHPIAGYGAVQIGAHRFCHQENGTPDCGVFRFVHVWRKEGESWKITRVISYGH